MSNFVTLVFFKIKPILRPRNFVFSREELKSKDTRSIEQKSQSFCSKLINTRPQSSSSPPWTEMNQNCLRSSSVIRERSGVGTDLSGDSTTTNTSQHILDLKLRFDTILKGGFLTLYTGELFCRGLNRWVFDPFILVLEYTVPPFRVFCWRKTVVDNIFRLNRFS